MTCFATGSSPNSLVSHIIKSPFVGFYSSPVSPLATLSFLNQQSMCHGHSMHNRSPSYTSLNYLQCREEDGCSPRLSSFPPSGRLISPLQTPARLSRISSSMPTYSQGSSTTLSFCLPTPRAPHSLLCAASEPGFLLYNTCAREQLCFLLGLPS